MIDQSITFLSMNQLLLDLLSFFLVFPLDSTHFYAMLWDASKFGGHMADLVHLDSKFYNAEYIWSIRYLTKCM